MIKSSGKKNVGDVITCGDINFTIINKKPDYSFEVTCNLNPNELLDYLESNAHIPIPPYIRQGIADERDKSDYQTTYAKKSGSVAAPTAGLHFTQEVFQSLEDKGIEKAFVTLHVGAGTFLPVKTDDITEHEMHSELYEIERSELEKMQNKDLIAVGTTSLRVLESCWDNAVKFEPPMKETNIFLHPGIEVKSIKGLITNFHLPESSLIMLVSALIGREKTLELYQLAIEKEYRFFSYGDAMLILR
jgi:S-adenosylmethionine:tRNA ribosyltransferase-isomerase